MPSVLFWPSARTPAALALAALNAANPYHLAPDQVREGFRHGEDSTYCVKQSSFIPGLETSCTAYNSLPLDGGGLGWG
jgi:hypothetical protein